MQGCHMGISMMNCHCPQVLFWKQLARELIEYSEKGVGAVRRRIQDVQEIEEAVC
jgi:hypothetical protein